MAFPDLRTGLQNRFLSLLPASEQRLLFPHLEFVELRQGQVLYGLGDAIDYVYFPHRSVISLVTDSTEGRGVEAATIGDEGLVGISVFLGGTSSAHRTIVQIEDGAWRMPANTFREVLGRCPQLASRLGRYTDALIALLAQSTACIALHPVHKRCARWLLMSHDRIRTDTFQLTHEFLADMLGAQRPTVTVAAGMLQRAGLIRYRRGLVTIIDRSGLEAASCECYRLVSDRFAVLGM